MNSKHLQELAEKKPSKPGIKELLDEKFREEIKRDLSSTYTSQSIDDPFVQKFIKNEDLFAEHELQYLDQNCEYSIQVSYEDLKEELDRIKRKQKAEEKEKDWRKWTTGMFERNEYSEIQEDMERMSEIADEDGYFL